MNDLQKNIERMEAELAEMKEKLKQQESKKKTGVVLSVEDSEHIDTVFVLDEYGDVCLERVFLVCYEKAVSQGNVFYDEETALKAKRLRELEQELRIAQEADGGNPDWDNHDAEKYVIEWYGGFNACVAWKSFHKICFNTEQARDKFFKEHADEDLDLLIMGV